MSVILNISLRNLVRQKRRNILLGTAIAFGAMVLIMANSFSHGISEVLFNRVVKYANGHISVSSFQNGNMYMQVFHDGPRMLELVKKEVPDVVLMQEAIGIMARAIGNGKGDNVIMVGVDLSQKMSKEDQKEYSDNFKFLEGSFLSIKDSTVENPVVMSEQKAKYLKVKKGDVLRTRFQNIYGQNQSARLTITGIFKPANMFMSAPIFLNINDLKKLSGYGPHDIAGLNITIKNPKKMAIPVSNRIHDALKPGLAVIPATLSYKGAIPSGCFTFGFRNDSASHAWLARSVRLSAGDTAVAFGKEGVMIGSDLASGLSLGLNDTCTLTYKGKYDSAAVTRKYMVRGIVTAMPTPGNLPKNSMLINEKAFFATFYSDWPAPVSPEIAKTLPKIGDSTMSFLAPEYILCKRSKSTDEMTKLYREIGKSKFKGAYVDVESMYESASAILKMESVLNMITLYAGLLLFFIILIGVVNTLRMTIRERTREIGTVRAIGMQRKDVRNSFLYETGFLALFSSFAGVVAAFIAMWGISQIAFNTQDNPFGMLLIKGHISFVPTFPAITGYVVLIVFITLVTAWVPARRASKLSAANAMRHYE